MSAGWGEVERRVRESFDAQTFMEKLGAEIAEISTGQVAIRLPNERSLAQQHGFMHAGAMVAILDSACGYAAMTRAEPQSHVLTAEFKVNLLAPVRCDAVLAEARVVRAGRTLTVCLGDAYDADDRSKHLATMLASIAVVSDS